MENSLKNKKYLLKLLPVTIWHILYLIFCNMFGKYTRVYFDLVFYLGIAIYFFLFRDWRFLDWNRALKHGKKFWFPVLFTVLGMAIMFCISIGIGFLFKDENDGMAVLGVNSWTTLFAFAIVTIILPPISEEVFYRKAIILFDSKMVLLISIVVSILLYASEHSLMPLGILQASLWAIPLSIGYIKTKNIYVCITAHFICNLVFNGMTVISCAIGLINKI
jgi:membrane protease YdiL (CAAX protease family)